MRPISKQTIDDIISLLDQGHTLSQVHSQTGVHTSTISRLRKKLMPDCPKSKGGRPRKLCPTAVRHAQRIIGTGEADTAVDVSKILRETVEEDFSTQTVRHALKRDGMKAVVKKKRPLLTKCHMRERLDFALAHKDDTVEDHMRVIWSDETKVNRIGSDGRKWVWKKEKENLNPRLVQPTVKHGGGSVMVWGCFGWDGVGTACRIHGKMDADLYTSILEDELQLSLQEWGKTADDIIFQQDNDPKHTSKKAKNWFQSHEMRVMVWPPQSPDLNPIEHLWGYLKHKLAAYPKPPGGVEELWEHIQVEWEAIPVEECRKLIRSMPDRIQAVIKAKGGYTKY